MYVWFFKRQETKHKHHDFFFQKLNQKEMFIWCVLVCPSSCIQKQKIMIYLFIFQKLNKW